MKFIWEPGKVQSRVDWKSGIVFSRPAGLDPLELSIMQSFPGGPSNPMHVTQPCLLWVSGSVWMGGRKDFYASILPTWAAFARNGYTVAACMYRTRKEAKFPAQIQDVLTAVRFLRANASAFSINPERIGVFGLSAGGHLTSLAAMNTGKFDTAEYAEFSSEIQAAIEHYGPADLNAFFRDNLDMLQQKGGNALFHRAEDIPEAELLGFRPDEDPAAAAAASPVTYVGEKTCPMMIFHGDADPLVPVEQSRALYDALCRAGCQADYYEIPGAGHATPEFFQDTTIQKMIAFFDTHLK